MYLLLYSSITSFEPLRTFSILNPKKNKKGNIINIGSTASLKGYKTGGINSSSKFTLRSLSQYWQAEIRHINIRVTQVNPSEVTTDFANLKEKKEIKSTTIYGQKYGQKKLLTQ